MWIDGDKTYQVADGTMHNNFCKKYSENTYTTANMILVEPFMDQLFTLFLI